MVTAGAASALTLGAAGCLTVANHCGIRAIPVEVAHLKNEVLVQKAHRYGYDQALLCCGVRMVEVETLEQYEAAFNERTVMAHFYNAAEQGQICREDWIRVAHAHGVPCFNDAAADIPPISNLWNYTKMGFDLVTFSGGKGIRGPQNAGLLLGRKDLIAAAAASNNPFDGVGRGMKVAKEQIVGMVAAVDWLLSQTDAGMEKEFRRRADRIATHLKGLPSLETEVAIPPCREPCSPSADSLQPGEIEDLAARRDDGTPPGNSQHRAQPIDWQGDRGLRRHTGRCQYDRGGRLDAPGRARR